MNALPTICLECGKDAIIWGPGGNSYKCDECGANAVRPGHEDDDDEDDD